MVYLLVAQANRWGAGPSCSLQGLGMAGRNTSFSTTPTELSGSFLDPAADRDHHKSVLTGREVGWLLSKAGVRVGRGAPPPASLSVGTWV